MRKKPRQARSRALVESLIDATCYCIAEEGLENCTTVRIAERAGVSVGSLYQYFDRKEDLFEAVLEKLTAELEALVSAHARARPVVDLPDFNRALLDDIWRFLEQDQGRYLHVVRYWAQLDSVRFLALLERKMSSVLSSYLRESTSVDMFPRVQARLYVLVNAVIFSMVRYIGEPDTVFTRDELMVELTELLNRSVIA